MAPRIIFQDTTWTVTQDPTMAGRNDLVRFRCHNGRRCLLDQIAEWTPDGWSSSRWIPKSPKVPLLLINWVVAYMRRQP